MKITYFLQPQQDVAKNTELYSCWNNGKRKYLFPSKEEEETWKNKLKFDHPKRSLVHDHQSHINENDQNEVLK